MSHVIVTQYPNETLQTAFDRFTERELRRRDEERKSFHIIQNEEVERGPDDVLNINSCKNNRVLLLDRWGFVSREAYISAYKQVMNFCQSYSVSWLSGYMDALEFIQKADEEGLERLIDETYEDCEFSGFKHHILKQQLREPMEFMEKSPQLLRYMIPIRAYLIMAESQNMDVENNILLSVLSDIHLLFTGGKDLMAVRGLTSDIEKRVSSSDEDYIRPVTDDCIKSINYAATQILLGSVPDDPGTNIKPEDGTIAESSELGIRASRYPEEFFPLRYINGMLIPDIAYEYVLTVKNEICRFIHTYQTGLFNEWEHMDYHSPEVYHCLKDELIISSGYRGFILYTLLNKLTYEDITNMFERIVSQAIIATTLTVLETNEKEWEKLINRISKYAKSK